MAAGVLGFTQRLSTASLAGSTGGRLCGSTVGTQLPGPHQLAGALLYRVQHGPHAVALQQLVLVTARRLRGKVLHYQPLQPAERASNERTAATGPANTGSGRRGRQQAGSPEAAAAAAAACPLATAPRRAPGDSAPHAASTQRPSKPQQAHRSTSSCAWRVSSSSVLAILP